MNGNSRLSEPTVEEKKKTETKKPPKSQNPYPNQPTKKTKTLPPAKTPTDLFKSVKQNTTTHTHRNLLRIYKTVRPFNFI